MGLYGNLTKTLLEESSCCCFCLGDGKTVEFAGKLLRIRRSRKQRDRCWPSIVLRPIREKHSNESWNWGPFLESPANFSGQKTNIQIEI